MPRFVSLLAAGMLLFLPRFTNAQTVIGDLNNFDTLNDTGQICYGFEIEIDDIHSTDITYTFDWNHYGVPQIREDTTDPAHPKVFVRYQSTKDSNGQWGANGSFTNVASPTITPPQGHTCTDTSVNEGCEHFGVGYFGTPTTVKYHWLVDDYLGGLVYFGTPVSLAKPAFVYTPPVNGAAAQVVAVIPAPAVPVAGREFGEPSFVKVIKTTSHNANPVALANLISDDADGDGKADWQHFEPDEVETEWRLLQATVGGGGPNEELAGGPDDMGNGSEVVTRRYEFYKYGAAADTIDGETGEAMCSEVQTTTDPNDPLYMHGVGTSVGVTDANGDTYYVDCQAQVVVGNYIGAQMVGFDAAAALGLVDNLQDGDAGTAYTPRTVVVGGVPPYSIVIASGSLPAGLSVGDYTDPQTSAIAHGVLSGTPTEAGTYNFTVSATDAVDTFSSRAYTLHVGGAPPAQATLSVQKTGSGTGGISGNGIDCGTTCSAQIDVGTQIALSAAADVGSRFGGWSGACTGAGQCAFQLNDAATATAEFVKQWMLSVSVSGTGTVTGSGIDCGATCAAMIDQDASVTLAASPGVSNYFVGWGGDCSGTGTCSPAMTAARSVTATFVPLSTTYTLSVSIAGTGTVTSDIKGINCGNRCSQDYAVGSTITLTVKANKKHPFANWGGACADAGTSSTCTVQMLRASAVTATFN